MTSINTIHNHVAYQTANDVKNICAPLFNEFNFNYFVYSRIYSNNSSLVLISDKNWYFHYLTKQHPIMGTSMAEGTYTWDKLMPYEAVKDGTNIFNHHNGIVILKKRTNYIEQLELAAPTNQHSPIEFCLNKSDLLNKFVFYFKDQARKLIELADKNRVFIPNNAHYQSSQKHSYNDFVSLKQPKKIYFTIKSKEVILSKREYEVLLQLANNKTTKEIANTLQLSPRTVESHLIKIKAKSNCERRSQLVEILKENLLGITSLY